jgi:hypothetical protein
MDGLVSPEEWMARGDLVAGPAEHVLVFCPADKRRVKTEFGYADRKGVRACDRGPSGLGEDHAGSHRRDVFT